MLDSVFNFSSVSPSTSVAPYTSQLTDHERLEKLTFHIEHGDYFGSLAALLGFVEERLAGESYDHELACVELEAVRAARKDLQYLNNHCRIEPHS